MDSKLLQIKIGMLEKRLDGLNKSYLIEKVKQDRLNVEKQELRQILNR